MLRHFLSRVSRKKLCLVADRSLAIREAAALILTDLRFHVAQAESGEEALRVCRRNEPDAILVEGAMASADRFAFLRTLAKKHTQSQPKIILCTADRNASEIALAIEAGAHEYVIKPFDRSILTAKLEKLGLTAS